MATRPKLAAEALAHVTGDARPVLDLDEALAEGLKIDAANAYADQVLAEIEVRRLELGVELMGDEDGAAVPLERARRILADRRRRAEGLMKRAGVKGPADLAGRQDMRLWIANQLASFQREQVMLEERFANAELYAVSDDELTLPRHPNAPQPPTASRLRVDALAGRARIRAHVEWLEAHKGDGPEVLDDVDNAPRQEGVQAFRRFVGAAKVEPSGDAGAGDDGTARARAEAERLAAERGDDQPKAD